MAFLDTKLEVSAFTNLLAAAAVNKRLLMRILAHLEQRPLEELHKEVAALHDEFLRSVGDEVEALIAQHREGVAEEERDGRAL